MIAGHEITHIVYISCVTFSLLRNYSDSDSFQGL